MRNFHSFSKRRHWSNPAWISQTFLHLLWDVVWEEENAHKHHPGLSESKVPPNSTVDYECRYGHSHLWGIPSTECSDKDQHSVPWIGALCTISPFSEPPSASPASKLQSSKGALAEADPLPSGNNRCLDVFRPRVCEPGWKRGGLHCVTVCWQFGSNPKTFPLKETY